MAIVSVKTKPYRSKANVGKNMSAILKSFVINLKNNTNANASVAAINSKPQKSCLSQKKVNTKSTLLAPSPAKKSMDGKMCLCSTSLLMEIIDER